jgi:hypothetical protein
MRHDAEQMERIGLVWVGLENLPIDLLGRGEAAGLMMIKRGG